MFEVKEKVATSEYLYSTMDFEEVQKQRLMGKLFEKLHSYYQTKIMEGEYKLDTYVENGYRYAMLLDAKSNEVIE